MILDADGQVLRVRDRVRHLPTGKVGTIKRTIRSNAGVQWDGQVYEQYQYVSKTLPSSLRKVEHDQRRASGKDRAGAAQQGDRHRRVRRAGHDR